MDGLACRTNIGLLLHQLLGYRCSNRVEAGLLFSQKFQSPLFQCKITSDIALPFYENV